MPREAPAAAGTVKRSSTVVKRNPGRMGPPSAISKAPKTVIKRIATMAKKKPGSVVSKVPRVVAGELAQPSTELVMINTGERRNPEEVDADSNMQTESILETFLLGEFEGEELDPMLKQMQSNAKDFDLQPFINEEGNMVEAEEIKSVLSTPLKRQSVKRVEQVTMADTDNSNGKGAQEIVTETIGQYDSQGNFQTLKKKETRIDADGKYAVREWEADEADFKQIE